MTTLEIIRLRLGGESPESLVDLIHQAAGEGPGSAQIRVYRHATLHTDITVHLVWTSPKVSGRISAAGLGFASVLREYGMVDHSVWVEESPAAPRPGPAGEGGRA